MPGIVEVGEVSTLAGSEEGFADGVGYAAQFSSPTGIAVDLAGIVYVADTKNQKIRTILPDGRVSTLAGSTKGYTDGIGAAAQFSNPEYIAVTGDGIVYVLNSDYGQPYCIRKILPNGTVSTLVRLGDRPHSITVDSRGYIYIGVGERIVKILPDGTTSLLQGIIPRNSRLTIDNRGNVYLVVDGEHNSIVKILPDGTKHTLLDVDVEFVGGPIAARRIFVPHSITVDNRENLYITDSHRIRKIYPDGTMTILAGKQEGFLDGRGSEARFSFPTGIAIDNAGVLYIADTINNRIRKMAITRRRAVIENDNDTSASGSSGSSGSGSSAAGTGSSASAAGAGSSSSAAGAAATAAATAATAATAASAYTPASAAAAYSNFEGNGLSSETRGRLWWQLNQMTCPTREADSHIPFVKSQLMLLYKTAKKTIESYKDKADPEQMAIYRKHLINIFTGVEASFTSLNSTSVKCAMLFTKMLKAHLPDGVNKESLYEEKGEEYWESYWDSPRGFRILQDNIELRGLVFHDEHPGCIPSCKNKGIVVLLGEMTLYELIWSYANDLYFIGLPTGLAYADGDVHTPLTFIEHDCEHMEDRANIENVFSGSSFTNDLKHEELQRRKARSKENMNILKCLQYIRDKPKNIQDTVLMLLFLIVHEKRYIPETILDGPLPSTEILTRRLLKSITYRLQVPNDMAGFLPHDFDLPDDKNEANFVVEEWLYAQMFSFVDTWNASLASDAVAMNESPNANTVARYDARTKANAAEWNARGGRRTKRRKSVRRKTRKNRPAHTV